MGDTYFSHLQRSSDLITPYEEIRAGFIALALERNRRATPTVELARSLKAMAMQAKTPAELMTITGIESALISAAGVSDKAAKHMLPEDKKEAIQGLIANFLEPAGSAFVEELVFRYLLTRGDALGGSMRNVGGVMAQRKLSRSLISALALSGKPFQWLHSMNSTWSVGSADDADIEIFLRGLSWHKEHQPRTMIFNLNVPLVRNNVDLCLLSCEMAEWRSSCADPSSYLALGELKGGIDPAGADEHWKTARTALLRVRDHFSQAGFSPDLFFVGAAIAKKMSEEIWLQLQEDTLANAANLTNPNQVAALCQWLVRL